MNQKSLDKKIKYGEPCPECGLSWAHGSVKCSYHYPLEPKDYGSTGQTNQKSPDKKKTKELEIEQNLIKILTSFVSFNGSEDNNGEMHKLKFLGQSIALTGNLLAFIQSLLTQQRTELLEEIKDLQTYVLFNDTEKLISLEEVKSLLNKKDEQTKI